MIPRLMLALVVGLAAGCGGRTTSRDAGAVPDQDSGPDALADAAPSDAGGGRDAGLDGSADAGRCLVEVCECRSSPCPAEARFCCESEGDELGERYCYPTDPGRAYMCSENPLDSAEPSDCREDDHDGWDSTFFNHPERCPDERPYCCGYPDGLVLCADHLLTGWGCSIGIAADCADPSGTTLDSTLCPDDYPWCCVYEKISLDACSPRYPPPEGWRCDAD